MKTQKEIETLLEFEVSLYKQTNAFGQSVVGQKLAQLCWILDIDYSEYHKKFLAKFDKAQNPKR